MWVILQCCQKLLIQGFKIQFNWIRAVTNISLIWMNPGGYNELNLLSVKQHVHPHVGVGKEIINSFIEILKQFAANYRLKLSHCKIQTINHTAVTSQTDCNYYLLSIFWASLIWKYNTANKNINWVAFYFVY